MSQYGGENPYPSYPPPNNPGGGYGAPPYPPYNPQPKVRFEAIGEAWQLLTQQMGTWIGAMLIMAGMIIVIYVVYVGVLVGFITAVGGTRPPTNPNMVVPPPSTGALIGLFGGMAVMGLLCWAGIQFLMGGLFRMALKQVRGEYISVSDVFSEGASLPTMLLASILVGVAGMLGALFCVIPGYIVSGLLMLTLPIIIDQRVSATEAMSRSGSLPIGS